MNFLSRSPARSPISVALSDKSIMIRGPGRPKIDWCAWSLHAHVSFAGTGIHREARRVQGEGHQRDLHHLRERRVRDKVCTTVASHSSRPLFFFFLRRNICAVPFLSFWLNSLKPNFALERGRRNSRPAGRVSPTVSSSPGKTKSTDLFFIIIKSCPFHL
jgi:hypothetical protein